MIMRFSSLALIVTLAACSTDRAPEASFLELFDGGSLVDLTYTFDEETVYWPTADGFKFEFGTAGVTPGGFYYEAHSYSGAEHGGTHLDAPIHFFPDRQTVDQIPLDNLVGSAVVIDVSAQAGEDADYQITQDDIIEWEETHGAIPDGSIVLFKTGFGRYWPNRSEYLGTDERGPDAVAKLHFAGLHPEAAQWLVDNRTVKAIGIDTASIDYGQSTLFESHQILFEQNIPAFENVAHLELLPETGSLVIALPMNIASGSGAPLRIIAWIGS